MIQYVLGCGEEGAKDCESQCAGEDYAAQSKALLDCASADTNCDVMMPCLTQAMTPEGLFGDDFDGSCDAICTHVNGCNPAKDKAECVDKCDAKDPSQEVLDLNSDCIEKSSNCGQYIECVIDGALGGQEEGPSSDG